MVKTNPKEFKRFHELVKDYNPYYLAAGMRSKKSWDRKKISFEKALGLIERGFNISIFSHPDSSLVFIDVDYMNDMVFPYKNTLKCISGSRRGFHLIYTTDDIRCEEGYNGDAGEFQAHGKYIIAPGSCVPNKKNNGLYYIANHIPPSSITFEELPKPFQRPPEKSIGVYTPSNNTPLNKLKIEDIFPGQKKEKNFENPFHGSEKKQNSKISGNLIFCYRCWTYHNPISALAVLSGQIECNDGYPMSGDKKLRKEINEDELFIWAIINGYLKEDEE